MTPKKVAGSSGQHTTDLRAKLREALEITSTDAELVERMIASGALQTAVQVGTYNTEEAAQALGIAIRSVRTLATQSAIFPRPTITERRYARNDIQTYANTRQKRPPRTPNTQKNAE